MTDQNDILSPDNEAAPSRKPVKLAIVAVAVAVLGGVGWFLFSRGMLPGTAKPGAPVSSSAAPAFRPVDGLRVLAEVNGQNITSEEVEPLLRNGLDRAIAIDRMVTRLLAADAARDLYPDASKAAREAAEREVLASLYLNRRSAELLQAVTDAEIDRFYKDQIRDSDYAAYKLSYYLTQDDIDAATMERNIAARDAAALAKFVPVSTEGDGFIALANTPYGLGQLVATAKAGDYLRPARVRDGFLILHIEQVRPGKKPEKTPAVKEEIRRLIAQRRLSDELLERREQAQVKLKL